jgi:hypothetical protein
MRKYKFKLVESYFTLFKKLSEGVESALKDGDLDKALSYLEKSQEKAIELGEYIEKEEYENHPTVKKLEDFCELLFVIHEELQGEQGLAPESAKVRLDQGITEVEKSADVDIKLTWVAIFFPYKASMWDSLESVWMKAKEDESCEAYVIPIPYYDKNPDGSVKQTYYEGDLYPDYVPVTSFEDFDFGKVHPEEVYIHNPYDDMNYVTSVHPFFYSENIKKFAEKLIYIPYFVLAEPDLENPEVLEHVAGYAISKGVVNADEVIVQSEAMKKAYVECLTARFGEETRATWEKKIKGDGSPKYEKLLRMKEQEQEIPEDWKKIIYKEDGTKKKIVFYNTSVVAILNQGQKMIEKIKDALEVFKTNSEDIALLWRPHPLIEATLESMVPEILEEYQQIVSKYKKEGWGIYDDTPDVDRAIIISDAYYGDGSSIVQLYEKLEKPIMIQNPEVLCGD